MGFLAVLELTFPSFLSPVISVRCISVMLFMERGLARFQIKASSIVLLTVCFNLSIDQGFSFISSSDSKQTLRAEVSDLEKKLASLEWQLDLLTAQATTITQGKKSRASARTSAVGQLASFDEELAKRSLEVKCSFLLSTWKQYTIYYCPCNIPCCIVLSNCSLHYSLSSL